MIVSWNATNACNLKCAHCYRDAGAKKADELSTDEGRALIDEIARAGFKIMIFSGGEPVMRDDLYELVAYARDRGLRPVLGTNGTLITHEVARKLKEAGMTAVGISLDSMDKKAHDDLRGVAGSWDAAVDGMRACREVGLPFQVHTTVMEFNYDEVEKITDFAVAVGARGHHVFFLVPTGRAVDIADASIKADQYERLLRRLLTKQREVTIEIKPTCAPQFLRIAKQMGVPTRFSRGCLAGLSYCLINPVGVVQACAYLDIPAGNVREKPFSAIWREAEVFQRLRTQEYSGKCGQCDYREVCGGCRARALFYYGDYMAEEPWCLYGAGRRG
ncbi:putative heme d1 biosynthesis radical SAM protein NirJ2 [Thermodesulfitimonas autotrophica]|uniref:Putative heme d1 biosynthesis radical SAM protein NirJ2 n=1 Tax=Thermodesulfitimonas autotrophica TaxID=1894989 RepID=A0A3N5ASU5_9THEO|nr:putative heme d1 biosynthesis radical SAM protein NirJ2 [Thermodesulfitimonas autotrophica]RPF46690.1 putative heme d1 biosynthesis radical SAM protein NirJ2 [Thermodesulfitimonas autotrophica]